MHLIIITGLIPVSTKEPNIAQRLLRGSKSRAWIFTRVPVDWGDLIPRAWRLISCRIISPHCPWMCHAAGLYTPGLFCLSRLSFLSPHYFSFTVVFGHEHLSHTEATITRQISVFLPERGWFFRAFRTMNVGINQSRCRKSTSAMTIQILYDKGNRTIKTRWRRRLGGFTDWDLKVFYPSVLSSNPPDYMERSFNLVTSLLLPQLVTLFVTLLS